MLCANERAILQKSHLVGGELHPLCNTATTGHLEGSQPRVQRGAHIGLTPVCYAALAKPCLSVTSCRARQLSSDTVTMGRQEQLRCSWRCCRWHKHGKAPARTHPICTHQSRVLLRAQGFTLPLRMPHLGENASNVINTDNLTSVE